MISIKAVYDGKNFVPLEDFPKDKKYNVVITFLEEVQEEEAVRYFSAQTEALSFWKVKEEDLYQDYLAKK